MTAGFGLEKLGLWTLRFPRTTILIILLITPLMIFSASRLGFSSDIREIFRSGSPDFNVLEKVADQYPGSGRDILMVFQGPKLFTAETLDRLRELQLQLGLIDDIQYVLSMFSARSPPKGDETPKPLFPFDLQDLSPDQVDALKKAVQSHPLVKNKLVSEDGELALFAIALKDQDRDVDALRELIGEIRSLANEELEGQNVDIAFTGLAVMRVEIIAALSRDQRVFGLIGMTIGLAFCWLYFRKFFYVVIAGTPAAVALIWLLGSMQLLGQEVNVLTNVVPVIVMVIVFANALHLLFGIRRNLESGSEIGDAIADAVRTVGPATVLTSATTTIALLSLTLVRHPFITGFGFIAALGTAIAYVAIMVTVPPMAFYMLKKPKQTGQAARGRDPIGHAISGIANGAALLVRAYPQAIALLGLVLTLGAGTLYALNDTRYRYMDNLPTDNPSYRAIQSIDKKLAGPNTLDLLVQWPDGTEIATPETLKVVRDAHQVLASEPQLKQINALDGVATWYAGGGDKGEADFFRFVEKAKSPTVSRVFAPESSSSLLTANFADIDAADLIPVLNRLETKLDVLRKRYGNVDFSLTGIVPVSAMASTEMIGRLNQSLLIAIAVIIGLIGVAFRSLTAGLVSILPNLLPIAIAGAGLYITGVGLQFTTVVAFTIGFGMAVDNTIHVLNRYRLERGSGLEPADAIDKSITVIGPVLIVSTIVLVAGVGATAFSELPVVQLYGRVSATVLTVALIGALLFLPAILRVVEDWRPSKFAVPRTG